MGEKRQQFVVLEYLCESRCGDNEAAGHRQTEACEFRQSPRLTAHQGAQVFGIGEGNDQGRVILYNSAWLPGLQNLPSPLRNHS